jgi:hypothetical protein
MRFEVGGFGVDVIIIEPGDQDRIRQHGDRARRAPGGSPDYAAFREVLKPVRNATRPDGCVRRRTGSGRQGDRKRHCAAPDALRDHVAARR